MKSDLIATVCHEIRTPLTGIRMVLHLLLERKVGDLTPVQNEMIQAARDDCERLLSTLDGLLDLSRIQSGREQLELRPVLPCELLDEARLTFQPQAGTRRITLHVAADESLPPVVADRARIGHVIGSFTSNALKFAPEGSMIQLTAEKVADRIRLSVIDSGPGIPQPYHARIFDKFFRLPGAPANGAGLGLSIAREIVQAHDGRIGLESEPPVATRFFCELPIAK
jgi:signal transduction histidine kinase